MQLPSSFNAFRPQTWKALLAGKADAPVHEQDQVLLTGGLPAHAQKLPHLADPRHLMEMPAPRLGRPVILLHGLAQHADSWVNLKHFLVTNPANGWGGVYSTATERPFVEHLAANPTARVFALDLSDNLASPKDVAVELRKLISLLRSFQGVPTVDVVTHSMGGLVAREALRQGESHMHNLIMVAPPNQGSYEADLVCAAASVVSRYPGHRMDAMRALRVAENNDYLAELNARWPQDSQRVKAAIITGVGIPTPDRTFLNVTAPGDSAVAARRAWLGDTPFFVAEPSQRGPQDTWFRDFQDFRYNHLNILSEPEVYAKICELLTADSPAPSVEPPASAVEPTFWDRDPSLLPAPPPRPHEQYALFD